MLAWGVFDFEFGRAHSEHGSGFIECHHVGPLAESNGSDHSLCNLHFVPTISSLFAICKGPDCDEIEHGHYRQRFSMGRRRETLPTIGLRRVGHVEP